MKKRAVVLDDDDGIRKVLSLILEQKGYDVITSADPTYCPVLLDHECKCPVKQACTDVLITDVNMPGMSGIKFLEHQKKNGCKVRNLAVMSGSIGELESAYAASLGCKVFRKPFQIDELREWIDECGKNIDPDRRLLNLPEKIEEPRLVEPQKG